MIARAGSGWQYVLTDLSLILFMVTAAALSMAEQEGAAPQASARSEPLAVWRSGEGAPPLADWLLDQSADARQQLTIAAHYRPGEQEAALAEAETLALAAGPAGTRARIVVEPGEGGAVATLAYDLPATRAEVARPLQAPEATTTAGN